MKVPGLVTIMVPVLNGELFLPLALDSLLSQDYPQFEIVILDNQSTDRTAEICREYERRDGRVRYVPDTVNRISHDAANHLATFITGEFCMIACDDDLWAPSFLSVLVKYLQQHPNVGLAFPNACYVDVEGNRGTQRLLSKRNLYARGASPLANVWRYLGQRRVVPTIFGVYRSDAYLAALPFDTFDETIGISLGGRGPQKLLKYGNAELGHQIDDQHSEQRDAPKHVDRRDTIVRRNGRGGIRAKCRTFSALDCVDPPQRIWR